MMTSREGGSITGWLGNLREGDQAAAQPLWEHYFSKLVTVARTRLRRMRRTTADQDEEDAALSAFNSFCAGAARGKFPQLADRDDIWRLLVVITARKAMAQANREGRQKRGGGRVVEEAMLFGHGLEGGDGSLAGLERIAAQGPSPEFAAMMAEECRRLLDALDDDSLRQVALSRMEGYNNDEIAEQLGCARRTVARRLDLIRKTWLATEEVA
jgi:DNA-directed RNA polymerase specialized sigma24 family protein